MRYLLAIYLLSISAVSFAKEKCDPSSIGVTDSSSEIERYFYTGTCHYRNKDYSLSVKNWEGLALLEAESASDEELKVDVLNNLGYMKFFGFGTEKDQKTAISYWREAVLLGHYEAEYHLCHAYADKKQPTYNLAKARKHCEKAKLIYKGKDDSNSEILSIINSYLEKIER
ncbi:sel1 repeat family protein [uncultured Pseudoteredinibacter sp.]|uniref:sel1 repeat family protein n=1 Tax=uncultured Pseudoteredinibacter sp. TaxID=1641701 RepID=UPI0026127FE0|nr:sel1 repeat family protein [uncultured Pseudoteredinibacter sp.]